MLGGGGNMHGKEEGVCGEGGAWKGVHGKRGVHVWWWACMAGAHVWWGSCVAGGVCGRGHAWYGVCMVGMHGRGMHGRGACMAEEMATAMDGTHPTGMHSCLTLSL